MNPFPISEQLLCYFVAYLVEEGLAPYTIKAYLTAVRSLQIQLGLPDPRGQSYMPLLKRVQASICRARMQTGEQSRVRLPITASILAQMRKTLESSSHPLKVVLWAIACTAFLGFFRLGKLYLRLSTASAQLQTWHGEILPRRAPQCCEYT